MRNTSTLNLEKERKKYLIKKVNDKENTQYTNILPWKPKPRKPTLLECSTLLLSHSFKIKGYMPNLGPHLRHNQHHTLLLYKRTTNQFGLHLYDQQPLRLLIQDYLFHHYSSRLVYRIYSRKNPK
jgi:hypothetical protein